MTAAQAALDRLDLFLRTYPVRILKGQRFNGILADYYCPLAGMAILLTENSGDTRKSALQGQGLTVLSLHTAAISRSFDELLTYIDDQIRHALTADR